MHTIRRTSALLALTLVGCRHAPTAPAHSEYPLALDEHPTAPGQSVRRVAVIQVNTDPLVVDIAQSATVGTPVGVDVTTYGGGCMAEDATVVKTIGLHADVVPYQQIYTPLAGQACTMDLRVTRRHENIVFTTAGTATVRVVGRAVPGDSLIVVERSVTIR
ncbi:MAG: hypothetical protein NVS9B3_00560 [Gemmatimonadaceae bacterium]